MRFIKQNPVMAGVLVGILILLAVSYTWPPEGQKLAKTPEQAAPEPALTQEEALVEPAADPADRMQADLEYIDAVFPVLSAWEPESLKVYLTEATLSGNSNNEIEKVLAVLEQRLGELKHYDRPVPVSAPPEGAESPLAGYHFVAWYATGSADVNLVLEASEDSKRLHAFNIEVIN